MAKFNRPNNCLTCPYKSETFSFLKLNEKHFIQNNCLIVNFKKGENICKQNLKVTHSLYLSQGLVKVFVKNGQKSTILNIVSAGKYIGLQSIFDDDYYNFSITALEPSRVCMVDVVKFRELCRTNSEFLYAMTKSISECTNQVFKRLTFLNQKSVKARLATSLLYFANEIYKSDDFTLSFSRQDLADYIGVSRENLVRVLGEFKRENIIDVKAKKIKILSKEILQALSQIG